mmetsp:Transcript_15899/g.32587  ORF Transcript_15899/g.32587 Transcript_15899/m.32587 type:complete len:130 (+) Transcript_15899:2597-2986(+)
MVDKVGIWVWVLGRKYGSNERGHFLFLLCCARANFVRFTSRYNRRVGMDTDACRRLCFGRRCETIETPRRSAYRKKATLNSTLAEEKEEAQRERLSLVLPKAEYLGVAVLCCVVCQQNRSFRVESVIDE